MNSERISGLRTILGKVGGDVVMLLCLEPLAHPDYMWMPQTFQDAALRGHALRVTVERAQDYSRAMEDDAFTLKVHAH